jgi:acetoin utilization protein AcuB
MSKPIPTVQKYMTTSPHTIGREQSLSFAQGVMKEFHIRHLPVLDGGKLLGILSERDITLVESLEGVDPTKVTVEDAMTQEPYSVSPDALLDEVVGDMATHKYGCAVVMQNNKVVGIFTTVDALKSFADLLHGRLGK